MNVASLGRWTLLVAVDTAAQVAFKLAGSALDVEHGWAAAVASGAGSAWVWAALALYLATFLIWMTILHDDDLSRVFPMTAIMAVTTAGAGVALFGEALSLVGVVGIVCIVVGVALLAWHGPRAPARPSGLE